MKIWSICSFSLPWTSPPLDGWEKKQQVRSLKPPQFAAFWEFVVSPSDKSSDPNQFDWPPIDPTASSFKPTNHYLFFLLKEMGVRTISK